MDSITFFMIKLAIVPFFVWAVSTAVRRWGHSISGFFLSLPVNSVIVLVFLALEQGGSFAAETSKGSLIGLVSTFVFSLVYSRLSFKLGWTATIGASFIAYFTAVLLLEQVSLSLVPSFIIVLIFTTFVWSLTSPSTLSRISQKLPRWEVPARIVSATALVLLITGVATTLGPYASGILAPFPVYTSILMVFIHKLEGAGAMLLLFRGLILGSLSAVVFFFLFALFISSLGLMSAIGLALSATVITYSFSLFFLKKKSDNNFQ